MLEKKMVQIKERSTLIQPPVKNAIALSIIKANGILIRVNPVVPNRLTGVTAINPPIAQHSAADSAAALPIIIYLPVFF
jgi:hypothetical protein